MDQSVFISGQQTMFDTDTRENYSEKVCVYTDKLWIQIRDRRKIDAARSSYDEAELKRILSIYPKGYHHRRRQCT